MFATLANFPARPEIFIKENRSSMRKGFSFLLGIFVCALLTNDAVAQSQAINPETQSEQFAVTVISLPPDAASANATRLSSSQASERIAEARELLRSQVAKTISADVTLAALDSETSEIN